MPLYETRAQIIDAFEPFASSAVTADAFGAGFSDYMQDECSDQRFTGLQEQAYDRGRNAAMLCAQRKL